ncbi:hypothetical protein INR49_025506 [Caranx melampygus]|nr:hypothetical protein INR49_025506 [Caranx melampygus]
MDLWYQHFFRLSTPRPAPVNHDHHGMLNQGATSDLREMLTKELRETMEILKRNHSSEVTPTGKRNPSRETPQTETPNPHSSYKKSACRTTQITLLGKRCLVKCTLDGVAVDALWDTGAQATIINEGWRAKHLPHTVLRPLKDQSTSGKINLIAANGTPISIIGWLNIELKLYKEEKETEAFTVPTLVANDSCAAVRPIIGFNVIEKSKEAKHWKTES